MIHLFQKTQMGLCLSQPTQEHSLIKNVSGSVFCQIAFRVVGQFLYQKNPVDLMMTGLCWIFFFFLLTMPGYDIFLKTFILKAIDFFYPGKGWEEDYKDERVFGFWQSYPFIVRSLSVNETRAQVPTIRTKQSLLDG